MRALVILGAALLAGCVAAEEPDADACGASGMQNLVGQSRDVLAAMTFPAGTRIIEPGMAITEDYSAQRLNIDLDEAGRIARVWCG
jgi:Peptidase inhibitor I78 family